MLKNRRSLAPWVAGGLGLGLLAVLQKAGVLSEAAVGFRRFGWILLLLAIPRVRRFFSPRSSA